MKILLDIKENKPLKTEDIIVYNKKEGLWETKSKDWYFYSIQKQINELKALMSDLQASNSEFKGKVDEKLKEYHDILQIITKEQ